MNLFDQLAGDGEQPEDRPKRSSTRGWQKDRNASRRGRNQITPGGSPAGTYTSKNIRPEEVSERVWGLAEQWLEMGEAHFGKRPPVNKQEFSKRLAAKINGDLYLRKWLRKKPEYWAQFGKWEDGHEFLNDVLAKMLDLFWNHLTQDQKNTAGLQFDFLDAEWDEWVYQASTAVQVAYLKSKGRWEKPELPSAVFDPSTIGQPGDDEPCTDPEFEGMTWGQVRALREEDNRDLPSLPDEAVLADEKAEAQRRTEFFARLKGAMLANRESHTTTEETTDEP